MAPGLSKWMFDIDSYLDPIVPPSILSRLPRPLAHFLGYRKKPRRQLGNLIIIFWSFLGVWCSLALIEFVSLQVPVFQNHGAPLIIGSFGAAAVLEFYAIESPLAQPRNAVLGQIIASFIGICMCKLFALSPHFQSLRWLAAALSCASATAVMALTGTVHPPAGATALIAVVDDSAVELGWHLIPLMMLGCGLMLVVALVVNNIQRRFPVYWWTPEETGRYWRDRMGKANERKEDVSSRSTAASDDAEAGAKPRAEYIEDPLGQGISITRGEVRVPWSMYLTPEEKLLLETISQRL